MISAGLVSLLTCTLFCQTADADGGVRFVLNSFFLILSVHSKIVKFRKYMKVLIGKRFVYIPDIRLLNKLT